MVIVCELARRGKLRLGEPVLDGLLYHVGVRDINGRAHPAVAEAEQLASEPDGAEPGRVDLRELLTFTIDPDEAKDFDDAISVRREGDGFRGWVHIADVARYVRAGSALDRDAAARALSVYVPGLVEPMLPERLSNGLCSLLPGRDRSTVTVEIPFSGDLKPGEARFYRSMIRSRSRLTYSQAEEILTGRAQVDADLGEALQLAEALSRALRTRRYRRGALRLETGEVSFAFDGRGGVERAWVESEPKAHALIEELMILANEAVGALLASRRRETLYRVHERPDPQAIRLLLAKLEALEVPTPPAPEHVAAAEAAQLAARTSASVARYVDQSGRGREAFPALVLRALKQARYAPENLGHSGLASRAYCHFTSPIRRYPDVVCHRALLREVGASDDPGPSDLDACAEHSSVREREAGQVEYMADAICLAWLLSRRLFEIGWDSAFEGEVTGVIASGVFVRFDGVFEGYLPVRRIGGDYYEIDPLGVALVGRRTGRRVRLGDGIAVKVHSIDRAQGKIDLVPA